MKEVQYLKRLPIFFFSRMEDALILKLNKTIKFCAPRNESRRKAKKQRKYHRGDFQAKIYHLWCNSKLDKLQTSQFSGNGDVTKWYPTHAKWPNCILLNLLSGWPVTSGQIDTTGFPIKLRFLYWIWFLNDHLGHISIGNIILIFYQNLETNQNSLSPKMLFSN